MRPAKAAVSIKCALLCSKTDKINYLCNLTKIVLARLIMKPYALFFGLRSGEMQFF